MTRYRVFDKKIILIYNYINLINYINLEDGFNYSLEICCMLIMTNGLTFSNY